MDMKECEHEKGTAHWDYWQCSECGWVCPSGQHRGPNKRGFFPSMEAVKVYDKFRTYPGMGEIRPMTPNYK